MFPYHPIDLTHTIHPDIPTWTGSCGFEHILKQDYETSRTTPGFRVQQIKMHGSCGTHIDAPCHCIPGGKDVADMDLQQLCVPCVMMDVSSSVHNGDYRLPLSALQTFEQQHKPTWSGSFVLFHTGWSQYWNQPDLYVNQHVFPSISGEVARYLVDQNIAGLGIDTMSPDKPCDGFPVHEAVLGSGRYILENICDGHKMPAVGGFAVVAPLKTKAGAEAPVRLIGLVEK